MVEKGRRGGGGGVGKAVRVKGRDSGVRVGGARKLGMCEMQGGRLQMLDVLHPSETDETVKFFTLELE